MKRNPLHRLLISSTLLFFLLTSTSCSFNPFVANHPETGNPGAAVLGAGIGGGSIALLGGNRFITSAGALLGGAIGYYVTTLRYDAGGIIQGGGTVYQLGNFVGIYMPSDQIFEPNTAKFLPQAEPILDSAYQVLLRTPNNNIIISGNTSGFYHSKWEQYLSEKRAQKVAAYLWHKGINQYKPGTIELRKLNYVGYGDYFPLAAHHTNHGIRENSRIQITSYPSESELPFNQKERNVYNIDDMRAEKKINFSYCHDQAAC